VEAELHDQLPDPGGVAQQPEPIPEFSAAD
jgi:hypothetical protein